MPDAPPTAEEVAHRGFASAFRGFDPGEVRDFLTRVAEEMRAAVQREQDLQRRLAEATHRAEHPVLEETVLTQALGEETSRVLASAQTAAHELRARAEENAARILREAHEEAQRIRAQAEVVLAQRTEEAEGEAAKIRQAAQVEAQAVLERSRSEIDEVRAEAEASSRQLVQDAKAARSQVLGDLARRRKLAETQIEQLRAGRERLLEAYHLVRRTLDEVTGELERVEDEARQAAEAAGRRLTPPERAAAPNGANGTHGSSVADDRPAPPAEPPDAPEDVAGPPGVPGPPPEPEPSSPDRVPAPPGTRERRLSSLRILPRPVAASADAPEGDPAVDEQAGAARPSSARPVGASGGAALAESDEEHHPEAAPAPPEARSHVAAVPALEEPVAEQPVEPPPAVAEAAEPVLPAEPGSPPAAASEPEAVAEAHVVAEPEPAAELPSAAEPASEPQPEAPSAKVEDLFARIRAGHGEPAGSEAPAAGTEGTAPPASDPSPEGHPVAGHDEALLEGRDVALEGVEARLARKLKRALQDEQNEVLDRLRSSRGRPVAAAVLPTLADQEAHYRAMSLEPLGEAASAGASFAGAAGAAAPDVVDLATGLAEALARPLHRRLHDVVDAGDVDDGTGLVERIGAAYRDCKAQRVEPLAADTVVAAFSRAVVTALAGKSLRWVVDDAGPCPDCDDNALAGPTPSGDAYPTGQPHPPAHAGCRCLVVQATP